MFGVVVPLLLAFASSHAYRGHQSAASEAQIRFAIENKYDDTGPGAKQPQFAYNAYKTLDDALIAYLDDPDTKLPDHERNRAIQKLTQPPGYGETFEHGQEVQRFYPKSVEEYTGYQKQPPQERIILTKLNYPGNQFELQGFNQAEPYKLQRIRPLKGRPLNVAHFSRNSDLENAHDQFNPYPKYTFSYGVNVPDTGDHKSAQETREGGAVRGFYSFLDADGAQRTVHYTADDKLGFQASVQRT